MTSAARQALKKLLGYDKTFGLFIQTSSVKTFVLNLRDRNYDRRYNLDLSTLSYSASSIKNYFSLLMPALSLQVRPYSETLYFFRV